MPSHRPRFGGLILHGSNREPLMSALCQKQTLARLLDMRAQTLAQKDYVPAPGMKQRIRFVPNLSI